MTQLGLLQWTPPVAAPKASEQDQQLARVEGRIAEAVLEFCRLRLEAGGEFFSSDLAAFVMRRCGGAPDSASRVLRALRMSGQVQVKLLSRSQSHYQVEGVR